MCDVDGGSPVNPLGSAGSPGPATPVRSLRRAGRHPKVRNRRHDPNGPPHPGLRRLPHGQNEWFDMPLFAQRLNVLPVQAPPPGATASSWQRPAAALKVQLFAAFAPGLMCEVLSAYTRAGEPIGQKLRCCMRRYPAEHVLHPG